MLPDSKKTELESSDQEASLPVGKNTEIVLVPSCAWKSVPTAISGGGDISKVSGFHLLQKIRVLARKEKKLQFA